ncbi:PREDICTED: bifunctional 3-dehydroquinate dehydratase/shikimate dehydrogenase, chloroplastic-like isoform X2 [Populus euphratica]|uniref:Bifunctional 3-dehydroquinate dehydratase/shikimate dehydrogenase, chloroplastic-like isoform X2 n=1 Tax=Populus euphratica TaxID=75702 RepID=A0AAJ6YB31_POPEU|nr:PREDICTED: bifunctional 3-dehydroquinate dehydratase/shikimate dehydrogenase, chloroplastic-like isoform X2 [Populus euphratica]
MLRKSVLMSSIVWQTSILTKVLKSLFYSLLCSLVVTCRPIWEGSQYEDDETKRREALRLAMQLRANYIDFELEIFHEFNDSMDGKKPDKFKVIVSSHNFHNTPTAEAMADHFTRIQATGADMVKISTTALDIKDYGKHFSGYGAFSSPNYRSCMG